MSEYFVLKKSECKSHTLQIKNLHDPFVREKCVKCDNTGVIFEEVSLLEVLTHLEVKRYTDKSLREYEWAPFIAPEPQFRIREEKQIAITPK